MHRTRNETVDLNMSPTPDKCRMAIEFGIEGDLRFISHHDTMRMFARALRRSGLPLAYSNGFNPQPKISLPLPRSVGIASAVELALVEFAEPLEVGVLRVRLSGALPALVRLTGVSRLPPGEKRYPRAVCYETALSATADPSDVSDRAERLLARDETRVERAARPGKPGRWIDIRPYILAIECDARTLRMRLRITTKGTARPSEVLSELGLAAEHTVAALRRVEIQWSTNRADDEAESAAIGKD